MLQAIRQWHRLLQGKSPAFQSLRRLDRLSPNWRELTTDLNALFLYFLLYFSSIKRCLHEIKIIHAELTATRFYHANDTKSTNVKRDNITGRCHQHHRSMPSHHSSRFDHLVNFQPIVWLKLQEAVISCSRYNFYWIIKKTVNSLKSIRSPPPPQLDRFGDQGLGWLAGWCSLSQ